MLRVTAEALRVSKGGVLWVICGSTKGRTYRPGPEGLAWRWWAEGWTEAGPGTAPKGKNGSSYGPAYWRRVGVSGSGSDQWLRADVEQCRLFKRPGPLPFADNLAHKIPPKCKRGGPRSHRTEGGERVKHMMQESGRRERQVYRDPEFVNPGNLLDTGAAGGGNIGSKFAHENEAPYDIRVPLFFLPILVPRNGLVLDPFSGSGTTMEAADRLGFSGVGLDIRLSQVRIGRARLERPHQPLSRSRKDEEYHPLFDSNRKEVFDGRGEPVQGISEALAGTAPAQAPEGGAVRLSAP